MQLINYMAITIECIAVEHSILFYSITALQYTSTEGLQQHVLQP